MKVIASPADLPALNQALRGAERLFLDTEFESNRSGIELCLLQISTGSEIFLVDAIALLVADDSLRTRLARAAVQRVRSHFDVSHCEDIFHQRVQAAAVMRRGGPKHLDPGAAVGQQPVAGDARRNVRRRHLPGAEREPRHVENLASRVRASHELCRPYALQWPRRPPRWRAPLESS